MHKKTFLMTLATVLVVIASLGTMGTAFADGPDDLGPGGPGGPGGMLAPGGPEGGKLAEYMTKALAGVLGISEADLEAMREKGETLSDYAIDKGIKSADLRAKMEEARAKAIELAVADGAITQAQADAMKERETNRENGQPGQRGVMNDAMRAEMTAATAKAFGLTSDELTKSMEDGKSLMEIASEKGMTVKDYLAKMTEAREAALKSAVQKGLITQEQADQMLAGPQRGQGGMPGKGFGPRNNGSIAKPTETQ